MRSHNNRTYAAAAYLAVVGVHQNRQDYKDEAKLMAKEYLMFGVHPQGYMGDFERWWNNNRIEPEQGLAYASGCAAEVIRIADVLARTGDMELYEYTTSQGLAGTEGGAKNLLFVVQALQGYLDGTYDRYGSDQAAHNGVLEYRIDGQRLLRNGHQLFFEGALVPANTYYENQHVQDVYMRRPNSGAKPFLSGHNPDNMWIRYAAPWLMFGMLEGKVWPYPQKGIGGG